MRSDRALSGTKGRFPVVIRMFTSASPNLILLAKSATSTIQGRQALVNAVYQSASPQQK
jgi:hypothetical protein